MTPEQTDRRQAPRWMRITLILSLAMNTIIVGLGVGMLLRMGGDGPREGFRGAPAPLIRALEPEERRALGRQIRQEIGVQGASRHDPTFGQELLALLRGESFDAEGFERLLDRRSARSQIRLSISQTALIGHLATLSAEDRRAYADRVEEAMSRGRKGAGKSP